MNTGSESPAGTAGQRFAVSPLQRAWLRELGLEKVWAPQPAPAVAGTGRPDAAAAVTRGVAAPVARAMPDTQSEPDGREAAPAVSLPGGTDAMTPDQPAAVPRGQPSGMAGARAPSPGRPGAPAHRAAARGPGASGGSGPASGTAGALRADQTSAVASLDMDALRERVLSCEACGLCAGRRHAVFGTGAQPASWLIVGEAPGEQEDRQGLPFVGRSGQLLDAMLASVGRSREHNVYIANVIKCRPPGNRNPRPEEIAACSPYLMRQIALLNPERILVVGRFAAQTLLNTDAPIGSLRGRLHALKTDAGREIPVIVSYHPAYLLRSPNEKAKAWADLQLAAKS